MRKIALLTVPFLILGLVSLSADDEDFKADETASMAAMAPKVELGAHSHLIFGIDLDTNATGFTNTTDVDLKVTIVPESTVNSGMMDDTDVLYAYIELKDFKWEVNSADGSGKTTAPAITTKLFMGPFSIATYSKPTIDVDYVDPKDDDKDGDPGYPDFPDTATEYKGSGGFTLGYKIAPVELSLGVISEHSWLLSSDEPEHTHSHTLGGSTKRWHTHDPLTHHDDLETLAGWCADADYKPDTGEPTCYPFDDPERNEANAYAFLGTIKMDIGDNADLEAAIAYGHEYGDRPIGIGAKATFDLDDIHPHIAFDGSIPEEDDADIMWDVGAGLKWDISEKDDTSYFETELVMYAPGGDKDAQLGVSATLKEGDADDGALEGLGASLRLDLKNLTSESSTWGVTFDAHYKVEGIKPFFMVKFSNEEGAPTAFEAGMELSMVEHLTTTLKYESKDITGGTDKGDVTAALKISY